MVTRVCRDRIATLVAGLSFSVVRAYVLHVVPGEPGARSRGGHHACRSLANIDTTGGCGYRDRESPENGERVRVPEAIARIAARPRNSASRNYPAYPAELKHDNRELMPLVKPNDETLCVKGSRLTIGLESAGNDSRSIDA